MHFAQELVDRIIDFLHDDPTTLVRVSLVSRAWFGRTRTYIYESLKITDYKLLSSDLSYLTPLCGYVKTLHITWSGDLTDPSAILDCFEHSELQTLAIHSCELHTFEEQTIRRCFAKFPCASITTLELHDISPNHRTLLILLSLFPNVDNLTISVDRWCMDKLAPGPLGSNHGDTVQRVSPPRLGGSFKFFDLSGKGYWGFHGNKLLRTIATLPLQFQTVSLNITEQSWKETSAFLNSCSKTVRKVFARVPCPNPWVNWPLFINFVNLEELHVTLWGADIIESRSNYPLFQSVVSPCLRRVIVELLDREIGRVQWPTLDETLVNLVERHEAYGSLALWISIKADPGIIRQSLPRVAQEGVLEVGPCKRPDYSA